MCPSENTKLLGGKFTGVFLRLPRRTSAVPCRRRRHTPFVWRSFRSWQMQMEDRNSQSSLRSVCRPGDSFSVKQIREIINHQNFDAVEVPYCVLLCLQYGKTETASFLIDHFALDVNKAVSLWLPNQDGNGRFNIQLLMLELAINDTGCTLMLLKHPQLDVGIQIRYLKTKLTVAGAVLARLLNTSGQFEEDMGPLQMLLDRDDVDLSQVWDVLFRHGLGLSDGPDRIVRPHFFPLLRFLCQHPKTADLINAQTCAPDGTGTGGAASGQPNTALMSNLDKICDKTEMNFKPQTFLKILEEAPHISLAGCSASGETVLHRLWKLGPAVVEKICERPEVDLHRANDSGETALDQVREQAYKTGDPDAEQIEELLIGVGAAGAPVDMITVKLPKSPGETVQVRAKDLRKLSVAVDTFLQTEYRSLGDEARDEFTIEHLSAGAFQTILDCLVFKDRQSEPERPRPRNLPSSLAGAGPTLLRAPQEEEELLHELLAAADCYLMLPVQEQLRVEILAWQTNREFDFSALAPEPLLDALFARDFFQHKRVPPSVQALLDQRHFWRGVTAMAEIKRARSFELEELLVGTWDCARRGRSGRGNLTFSAGGRCVLDGKELGYTVAENAGRDPGAHRDSERYLEIEGNVEFWLSSREDNWAPVFVQCWKHERDLVIQWHDQTGCKESRQF